MDESQENHSRMLPQSDLDFNLMTTDAVWGSDYISPSLRRRLKKEYPDKVVRDPETGESKIELDDESLWSILGFYTRDMRLANLSSWNGEVEYCEHYLNLAADCLESGYTEPFIICLSRVATKLELSQSKGGFLRKRLNTLTNESVRREDEPPKKGLFGQKKND